MLTSTPTLMTVASSGKTCSDVLASTSYQRLKPLFLGETSMATSVLIRKISGMPSVGMLKAAYLESSSSTMKTASGARMRNQFMPAGASGSSARICSLDSGLPPRSR